MDLHEGFGEGQWRRWPEEAQESGYVSLTHIAVAVVTPRSDNPSNQVPPDGVQP